MASTFRDAATVSDIAPALREIRQLRRRFWFVSALGIPAIVALEVFFSVFELPRWTGAPSVLALVVGWIWLSNRLEGRVANARCPRCGEPYFARQWGPFELRGIFVGSCQHCGLHLRADKHHDRDA